MTHKGKKNTKRGQTLRGFSIEGQGDRGGVRLGVPQSLQMSQLRPFLR